MRAKSIHDVPKTYVLIFEAGEEVAGGLTKFANDHQIQSATLVAIGALERCTVGYFDWKNKDYRKIKIEEQVEVLSMLGNFSMSEGKRKLHAHLLVGKADGTAHGGHLLDAIVRPTLEVIVTQSPTHLHRRWNDAAHLALIDVDDGK